MVSITCSFVVGLSSDRVGLDDIVAVLVFGGGSLSANLVPIVAENSLKTSVASFPLTSPEGVFSVFMGYSLFILYLLCMALFTILHMFLRVLSSITFDEK